MPLQNVTITVNLQNPTFDTPSTILHNITGLSPGTEYTVRVAASTVNGTGPFSGGSMIRTKDNNCKSSILMRTLFVHCMRTAHVCIYILIMLYI